MHIIFPARILEKLAQVGYATDDFPKPGECKYSKWDEIVAVPHGLTTKSEYSLMCA